MYDKKNNFILVLSCFVLIITFILNFTSTFPSNRRSTNGRLPTPTPIPDRRLTLEAESNIGYIKSIVRDGNRVYLSFDPIIYRVNDTAKKEYQSLCADAPEQCSTTDGVLIRRNLTSKTQTFSVSPDVVLVTHYYYGFNRPDPEKGCSNLNRVTPFDEWQKIFTGEGDAQTLAQYAKTPFRLEINPKNEVVLIYEIYQP